MAYKLKNLETTCDSPPSLSTETLKLLQETTAIHDIVLRINNFLEFQSIAFYVLDNTNQLCTAASFGNSPTIYRSEQSTVSLTDIANAEHWYFLPQGAVIAAFQTSADELLHYNWHHSDVLCVPFSPEDIPLNAFLAVSKPQKNHVASKNMQAFYGCMQWLSAEIKNTHLEMQLSHAETLRQRAEAALTEQTRRVKDSLQNTPIDDEKIETNKQQIQNELIQRNRELLSLQAAVAATASSLDVPFVLETVTWEVANLLNIEGCTIVEQRQSSDAATIIAKYGLENWWEQSSSAEIDIPCPLKQQVQTEKYAIQATISQANLNDADKDYMQQTGIKTLLVLPMIFQDNALGIVEVFDSQHERVFSDREISLTQLLANQAATTLTNARLYHQVQSELKERKKAQQQIAGSLREKEILLKEIHHRVKNNLQVISSLLFLQSRFLEDSVALQALQESRARVQTMALIHEKLYQSDDLAHIDFVEYLKGLIRELIRNYNQNSLPISYKFEGKNILLDINISVPCGLIVNELVSNTLKHAFPADRATNSNENHQDEISISLTRKNEEIELIVSDNGVGISPDIDLEKNDSLGMQLVTMLTQQIHGKLTLNRQPGTTYTIVFPAE